MDRPRIIERECLPLPPDVWSQLLLGIPLILCFEVFPGYGSFWSSITFKEVPKDN